MTAGFARTGSGRVVYDTGKVLIGLRAERSAADPGPHAEAIQTALLRRPEPSSVYDPSRRAHRDLLRAALCLAAFALLGVLLAWRG